MKIIFAIIIVFLSVINITAQSNVIRVRVNLIDQQTGEEINDAKLTITSIVQNRTLRKVVQSGDTLNIAYKEAGEWRIIGKTSRYKTVDTTIYLKRFKRGFRKQRVVEIDVLFEFDGQSTGEVDINAKYIPEIKFGSETLSVSDYVLIDESHQVLLTYPKRLDKGSELIWLKNDEIKGRRDVKGTALELISDFRGGIYLRCEKSDFQVTPGKYLELLKVNRKELENYTLPVLDSLASDRLYFSNYNSFYPAYDYFMVETEDTSYTKIRHIVDDLMMEQYRAEYKWADVRTKLWAWDMEAETGVDREVWVGANVFTNSIYYDPPIGDLYRDEQNLFVFDFYKDQIACYDAYDGEPVDSAEISFHLKPRKTGWEQEIVQDPVTRKMYTYFDDAGYMEVAEVDPIKGELGSKYQLHYRYVENIQIYDGMIYYIYRPFESPQKKYLYFEDINREKREASIDR